MAHLSALPLAVGERLAARGLKGSVRLAFEEPAPTGAEMVSRSHPLPSTLAEVLFEGALDPGSIPVPSLGRAGAWPTTAVKALTTIVLLRVRYKLTIHGRRERLLLAEEAGALAWEAGSLGSEMNSEAVRLLLEHPATSDLAPHAKQRLITQAIERISGAFSESIAAYAREGADTLANDHARVRAAAQGMSRVTVEPVLPPDVIGLFVLVPGT